VPAAAQGPDLDQAVIGSEGVLGVVTQATVRVHARPERRHYRALLFADWAQGLAAVREVMQGDRHPTTMRLSDQAETEALFKLRESGHATPLRDAMQRAFKWYLTRLRHIARAPTTRSSTTSTS
jgi:alkyldihydroxyacetonephosphate synthase